MCGNKVRGALVGTSLSLGLMAGVVPAFAGKAPQFHGVILQADAGDLLIETQSGVVSANISNSTRVERMVSGSLADLTLGAFVDLRVTPGTTTVTRVRMVPVDAPPKLDVRHVLPAHNVKAVKPPEAKGTSTPHTTVRLHRSIPAEPPQDGKVVGLSGRTITLRGGNGQTASYVLASNVNVTKIVLGSLKDLAIGETINVVADRDGGTATQILILNA